MEQKKISVLFDIDDTILDFKKAEKIAVSKTLRDIGIEPTDEVVERYSELNIAQWEKLELGLISRTEVLSSRFDLLFDELGILYSGFEAQKTYEKLLEIGHYYMPGAEELLKKLYGKYDLYLVSNGTASVQKSRLKSAGISYMFKGIFVSESIGVEKPSREYFDRCFAQMPDADISRCIIVGDSLSSDIKGGINAGIKTCWYNYRHKPSREDIMPDYTITELSELPMLLENIFTEE